MNLFADESVDRPIVERLRRDGHEVPYVAEMTPGISDDAVLKQANSLEAVLLTADKDFGELVYRQGRIHSGVMLIRLDGLSPDAKASIVSTAIRDRGAALSDGFSVITPATVRIRRRL
jgi:predicted nuclease of predicted toxin-antitoxin system